MKDQNLNSSRITLTMENNSFSPHPIRKLPAEVARKIAAGEVIDRPAAVVRELLDNAIDSHATKITVEIREGGSGQIRVTDNGCGMTAEDLSICAHTHTTSKILHENDLLSLSTLGFRGEALSSIDSVSNLEITTTRNGTEAWKLQLGKIIPSRLASGTIVSVEDLFENFPARKQFMKRSSAETLLCKQVFLEKALAWPHIEFRFSVDGSPKKILLPADTLRQRCYDAFEMKEGINFFYEIAGSGNGFTFSAILGSPDVIRSDRKNLMVFVNGRRIMEYSLLQAIEYGAEGHFPNGSHPFGILYVTIDPALVDFNIHPAKREARFRDGADLHHRVSATIKDFYRRYTFTEMNRENGSAQNLDFPQAQERALNPERWNRYPEIERTHREEIECGEPSQVSSHYEYVQSPTTANPSLGFTYLGQVLGTFLIVEKNDALYLVDQHAAHERLLYEELMASSGQTQELLIPYRIETSGKNENTQLAEKKEMLKKAGFTLVDEGDGFWQVTSVPTRWKGKEKDLTDELLDPSIEAASLVTHIYASAACRAACKDGDALDPLTANELVKRAFALTDPVCPHGRPLWTIVDRQELFRRVKRT